jgi:putative oxidoreductase
MTTLHGDSSDMRSLICTDLALPRGATIALTILRFAVAAFFLMLAWKSLGGDDQVVADFRRFGYPEGFWRVAGVMQLLGGLLLLFSPVAFWGAGLLLCVLVGALVSHVRFDPPAAVISPLLFVALLAPIAITMRPAALR